MPFKIGNNEEVNVFDLLAMVRGSATQDMHHFFGMGSQTGANATGGATDFKQLVAGNIPKLLDGKRIPINKVTNNPALASPSVTAMKFFGASPIFKVAIDQLVPKRVGNFPLPQLGAGFNAFNFQNNPMFSQAGSLQQVVGKILMGNYANTIQSEAHQLFNPLKSLATIVGKAGGADPQTQINPSSDAQKLIQMCAAGFGANGVSSFASSDLSDATTIAKEVSQYIKKLNG